MSHKLLSLVLLRLMIRGAEGTCLSGIGLHAAELAPVILHECWVSVSLRGTTVIQRAASTVIHVIRKAPCCTKVPQRHTAPLAAPCTAAAPQVHCKSVTPPDLQQPRPGSKKCTYQCSYTALSLPLCTASGSAAAAASRGAGRACLYLLHCGRVCSTALTNDGVMLPNIS
jgi:hypothetical protein